MDAAPGPKPSLVVRPPDRYGEILSPRRRRLRVAALGALAAAGLGWVLWAGIAAAREEVRWSDVGYDVIDDTTVEVTFTVVKDPDSTATCTLKALGSLFATVGLATVEVGPAERPAVTSTAVVRTQQRAVTGVVDGCRPA